MERGLDAEQIVKYGELTLRENQIAYADPGFFRLRFVLCERCVQIDPAGTSFAHTGFCFPAAVVISALFQVLFELMGLYRNFDGFHFNALLCEVFLQLNHLALQCCLDRLIF